MIAKKYMLILIGSGDNDLVAFAPHLKTLNFEVGWIQRSEQAVAIIRSTPHVSLIVINAVGEAASDKHLLSALREMHANLPIIWVQHENGEPQFDGDTPDVVLRAPLSPEDLSSAAATLLRERFYTDTLVRDLIDSVNDVVTDNNFASNLRAAEPVLKAAYDKAGELSTIVYFAGRGVAGHVILSASPDYLLVLHGRLFPPGPNAPKPSLDKLADLLGELCNQVTGRLRVRHQLVFNVGAPILVHGAQVVMRQIAGSPALVVRFSEDVGGFNVELCMHKLEERTNGAPSIPSLKPGDLVFL